VHLIEAIVAQRIYLNVIASYCYVMQKRQRNETISRLNERVQGEIAEIERSIAPIRRTRDKLRFIFKDSLLAGEWVNTSNLMVVTGISRVFVYRGLVDLKHSDEITGKAYTRLEYYESLRGRNDKAAELLIALASARLECPEDEVSLAAMSLPDTQRTSADGVEQTVPASGYYWRQRNDEGPGSGLLMPDIPSLINV